MTHPSQQSLDLAWARINALGSAEPQDADGFDRGYWKAIGDALEALESLGATQAEWDRENIVAARPELSQAAE
jgi:hypothetical protein